MVLASASGMARIATSTSKALGDAALRGQAAGAEVERRAASARRRRRCTVTVAGAVSVGGDPRLAQRQARERRGEAAVEPGELARGVGERADRQPARRPRSASGRGRSARPRPTARRCRRRRASRSAAVSVPCTIGRPSASLIRASASSVPTAVAPTARPRALASSVTPWPTSAASSVMSASSAPVASTSASAATGAMSGASRVRRPVAGASPALASDAGQPVRPDRDDEAVDRPPLARDRDVAGEVEHQPVERARAVEAAADVAAVDLAGEAERRGSRAPARRRCPTAPAPRARRGSAGRRRWRARWRSARRRAAGRSSRGRRGARRSRCRCALLDTCPFEAKLSCGFSIRRSSVRKPASSRTARPESVVSPASSRSSRGVAEREVGGAAVEGEVEAAATAG